MRLAVIMTCKHHLAIPNNGKSQDKKIIVLDHLDWKVDMAQADMGQMNFPVTLMLKWHVSENNYIDKWELLAHILPSLLLEIAIVQKFTPKLVT